MKNWKIVNALAAGGMAGKQVRHVERQTRAELGHIWYTRTNNKGVVMLRRTSGFRLSLAAMLLVSALPFAAVAAPQEPGRLFAGSTAMNGLLPIHVKADTGQIYVTVPPPGKDGVSARVIHVATLATGVGSASVALDPARIGANDILAFRRVGAKVAMEYENPRFRATNGTPEEQEAARKSFAGSTLYMADIAAIGPDGSLTIDISGFLTRDVIGVTDALRMGGAGDYKLSDALSAADTGFVKVFPDNIELQARQTYVTDKPLPEIRNIAIEPKQISVEVRHSFVKLPEPGFVPRDYDVRAGGFGQEIVDYGAPLGDPVVHRVASRFRLEKLDPAAPQSRVRKPIIFYIDRAAPEPIRTALAEGVGWWRTAFEKAGYIDAFQVKILPEGADPLDVRYNMVNWVNRATRGWSYGQAISDPRTGEIIKGSVLLGSLRVRQDILIFESLVGSAEINSGSPNDPVQVALARIRQLGAHEVGHSLGFEHNMAGSTQGRSSVMDYPGPRVKLTDGRIDLSDAYGVGVGAWDDFTVSYLYGEPAPGADSNVAAHQRAADMVKTGLRFVGDGDARPVESAHPWGALWDDGADSVDELNRMMEVRKVALANFGLANLRAGEPVENLRRKFVLAWLLPRYQVEAASKKIGGFNFSYAAAGDGKESAPPVAAAEQRAALDALLKTISASELTVPARLLPLLSAGATHRPDRQAEIETFPTSGGPVFDPLAAADGAAAITLDALLSGPRLSRLATQKLADPAQLGPQEVLDRLVSATVERTRATDLDRRIAYRTLVSLAAAADDGETSPEVSALIRAKLDSVARGLVKSGGDTGDRAWASATARLLSDKAALKAAAAKNAEPMVPPGMPIG